MTTSGAVAGTPQYSTTTWNGGEGLAEIGLVQVGARVFDPVIGRFLGRDPLRAPRTASKMNPYAFAHNDPINKADPTGMDPDDPLFCAGPECQGLKMEGTSPLFDIPLRRTIAHLRAADPHFVVSPRRLAGANPWRRSRAMRSTSGSRREGRPATPST